MCKNADKPCPGCKKHKTVADPLMFFTDAERAAIVSSGKAGSMTVSKDARS